MYRLAREMDSQIEIVGTLASFFPLIFKFHFQKYHSVHKRFKPVDHTFTGSGSIQSRFFNEHNIQLSNLKNELEYKSRHFKNI